jgi:anaerobic magnesium-protoporphyrin IX monomethyl ester cyclase
MDKVLMLEIGVRHGMKAAGGYMRVLLAGPDYEENLSIRYLSASLLSAGHEPVLAAFNSSDDIVSLASQAQHVDMVGLSMCFQSRAKEFLQLAQWIKRRTPEKLIVAGGHYASCAAEPLLASHPEIDVIVIHEGEKALVEIADAAPHLAARLPQIVGIAYRSGDQVHFTAPRPTLDDLDTLPFPDRRGLIHSIAGVPTSYLMGSRGCYGSCAYCCITTLHRLAPGKRFRQRSVDQIAEEMAALSRERGTRQFVFHDDNFLVPSVNFNHARISAFEKALKKRGVEDIALVIKCRPADANPEVLRRLKELGLVRVFLGVESATAEGLSSLDRIQSVEDSKRALEICADLDISAQFTLMTFHPDATLDTLRADVRFMRRFAGNPLNFCRAEIYAGTPLETRVVALGRAWGNYLAREYNLSDPAADRACNLSLDLFHSRCWGNGSLMQKAIGLDHTAAVRKRFDRGAEGMELCQRVSGWVRSVNLDTISLLEEVVELSASAARRGDAGFERALTDLEERESATRAEFLFEGSKLKAELETFRLPSQVARFSGISGPRFRFARQAAAAVLAIGIPAVTGCGQHQDQNDIKNPPQKPGNEPYYGLSEMAAPPLQAPLPADLQQIPCSLAGTVTDSAGAALNTAKITITNLDTNVTIQVTPNQSGQYVASNLPVGRYSVKAEARYFNTVVIEKIELKAGEAAKADIHMGIGGSSWPGCCEYAAAPLEAQTQDYMAKRKPFSYTVGEAKDKGTFQGIANVVYGDSKMWVQIFEANRDVVEKPGPIPYGTPITIPRTKRVVPKLISKVMPVYPPAALQQHVRGDVVLDVTLNEDGTVDQVGVIDGNTLLLDATTSAVKQWRYKPLLVNGKPVIKFVVVVSFGRGGKVR